MKIINRKAFFNYEVGEKIEAGLVLTGGETKSVFAERVKINEAFIKVLKGELFVINLEIHPYRFASTSLENSRRARKLLLHKKEILRLKNRIDQGNYVLIPTAIYSQGKKIKLEIALAKGKKKWDKRETIKKREEKRKIKSWLK